MKPYMRSRKGRNVWEVCGKKIRYYYEKQPASVNKTSKTFVLSFYITFKHHNDYVFIASGIPYSYTFLNQQLKMYQTISQSNENLVF